MIKRTRKIPFSYGICDYRARIKHLINEQMLTYSAKFFYHLEIGIIICNLHLLIDINKERLIFVIIHAIYFIGYQQGDVFQLS